VERTLVAHDLVVQRTRIASQVRWHLHELDPDLAIPSRGLKRHCVVTGSVLNWTASTAW
jgi:hypothetical protein